MEPGIPATLLPTKVAAFIATGPGVASAIATTSGRHLREGENIHEFRHGKPAMLADHLCLDQRHGRIAAAYTDKSYRGEAEK